MGSRRSIVLRVHTFGVPSTARYGLSNRRHQGGPPIRGRTPVELYRSLRGTSVAAALAAEAGQHTDLLLALCKTQQIGAELARRLLVDEGVVIETDKATRLADLVRLRESGADRLGTSDDGDD